MINSKAAGDVLGSGHRRVFGYLKTVSIHNREI